jgi:FixJ family two-component response regulator
MDNPVRILVIDDEEGLREGCQRALVREGHKVELASSAQSGLQAALANQFELVLLDVMMPDGSGIDLLQPMLEHDPDLVCIIITGFATVELAVQAIKRGAYDFISKPFTSDALVLAVNQGLERRRLSMEAKRLREVEAEAQELARAKEEMERLDQVKSQFMLTMAHELRAPVAAIQSYLGLIQDGYVSGGEVEWTLNRAQVRLQEVLDIIADLLDLARLKQAKAPISGDTSPQPMADILEEVWDLLRQQAQDKRQRVQVQPRSLEAYLDEPDQQRDQVYPRRRANHHLARGR